MFRKFANHSYIGLDNLFEQHDRVPWCIFSKMHDSTKQLLLLPPDTVVFSKGAAVAIGGPQVVNLFVQEDKIITKDVAEVCLHSPIHLDTENGLTVFKATTGAGDIGGGGDGLKRVLKALKDKKLSKAIILDVADMGGPNLVNHRLWESLIEDHGYLKIVEPLALNTIKGDVSDKVNDLLNQAIRGDFKGVPKEIGIAAKQIQGLYKTIGDQLYSEGVIANKIENYIPRMWNRKAIESDPERFELLLMKSGEAKNAAEAKRITESMLDIENQLDGGSGGQFFAAKRKFTFEDDSVFTDFLNTDLIGMTADYNYQAGKALAKKKVLMASNEKEFMSQWINPIVKEMKSAGKTLDKKEREQIRELYRSATGENMERYGSKMQTAADTYSLGTRLALLPLATIGSLTEVFINIGKAGVLNSVKGFAEASELSFKKMTGDLHSELMTKKGMTANEAFRELKKHSLAMEQAQSQAGNRLGGDDFASDTMQKVSNKFFRMNFLDQWTKFVQTTSYILHI